MHAASKAYSTSKLQAQNARLKLQGVRSCDGGLWDSRGGGGYPLLPAAELEFQHEIELKEKENLMNELLESREEVKRAYLEI